MNDFSEAMLSAKVNSDMGPVYKLAIEQENHPIESVVRGRWNGNYAKVKVIPHRDHDELCITIISKTLPNLKDAVSWYESMGAEVIGTKYREEPKK